MSKDKMGKDLPESFACPLGQFLRGGDRSFQVIWRIDLEVDLE